MANIERRRKQRKLMAILAAAGCAVILLGIAALIFTLTGKRSSEKNVELHTAVPTETVSPSPSLTTAPSHTDSPTEIPTQTPEATAEPTPQQSEIATQTDEAKETSFADEPVRISDEQSSALFSIECSKRFKADGSFVLRISGKMAMSFVNNTDRPLYAAEFDIGDLRVLSVTLDCAPARFTVENGRLTIPFVNELPFSGEAELFIEFFRDIEDAETLKLPAMVYDTSYLLTAYIESEAFISFRGCKAASTELNGRLLYTVAETSVHEVTLKFTY